MKSEADFLSNFWCHWCFCLCPQCFKASWTKTGHTQEYFGVAKIFKRFSAEFQSSVALSNPQFPPKKFSPKSRNFCIIPPCPCPPPPFTPRDSYYEKLSKWTSTLHLYETSQYKNLCKKRLHCFEKNHEILVIILYHIATICDIYEKPSEFLECQKSNLARKAFSLPFKKFSGPKKKWMSLKVSVIV